MYRHFCLNFAFGKKVTQTLWGRIFDLRIFESQPVNDVSGKISKSKIRPQLFRFLNRRLSMMSTEKSVNPRSDPRCFTFVGAPLQIIAGEQVQAQHDRHVRDRRHMSS
jgi:hypothetical protein